MIRTPILLTVALNLMMSAVAVQAATAITALPITISSPGTYVLKSDLTSPLLANDQSAILIAASAGTVVLDLKGYTLTIAPLSPVGPFITGISVQSSNVTIRNGTIQNFNAGINVAPPFSGGSYSGYVSSILVQNVTFSNVNGTHVDFIRVNSSQITSCTFLGFAQLGIEDNGSQTGNRFSENSFDGNQSATLEVLFPGGPMALKNCNFEAQ